MDRKVYRVGECPEEIVEAIINAKVDPKHDELNYLLDDEEDAMTSPNARGQKR